VGKDSYEFSHMSEKEKYKLLVAKVIMLGNILWSLWSLGSDSHLHSGGPYLDAAWILAAVFAYINLLDVKSELVELFEQPLSYRGREFMLLSTICLCVGLFKQYYPA
jgi:hypothetical protein